MDPFLVTFKALSDGTRLRLVQILKSGAFKVTELVRILGMGQSRVSRHLKILLDAGLVRARREGSWVYYTLSERWSGNGGQNGLNGEEDPGRRFLRLLGRELALRRFPEASSDREAIETCLQERRQEAERFFRDVAGSWDLQRERIEGPPVHLDRLLETFQRADTAVDLGTGTGILLARLSRLARWVIGIDAGSEMLEMARRNITRAGLENVELRLGALEHLPLPDGEADVMVANMVLHHVGNPPEALREARRGLRPGGRLLVADLAAHGEEAYRERLGDLWLGFEREDLKRWLDEADFELERFEELPRVEKRPGVLLLSAHRRE